MFRITLMPFTLVMMSFLICVPFFAGEAYSLDQKNFLWRVQSKTTTVYLVGSIHFLKKEIYPLSRKIEDAFEKSKVLVVEADINNAGRLNLLQMIDGALYTGDDTLDRHVSRETFELVKKEFSSFGIPVELINAQRPWFLALTLTSLKLLETGFDPSYGIDNYFLTKAQGQKRIAELESVDYQVRLLSGLSDQDQEMFLIFTLKDLNAARNETDTLVRAWVTGDTKKMESLLLKNVREDRKMTPLFEKIIYERNVKMTGKIEEFLRTGETCFVVVGAGHLVGNRGIVEMLRGKGYAIEQM